MNNTVILKIKTATTALFFAAALATGTTATAADNNPVSETASAKSFTVKYTQSTEEGYIFGVKYDNLSAADFDLIIKDETGEILYQRSFNSKNFSKKFQLDKSLVKAIFIIRSGKGAEQSMEVAVQSRTTEDVVISRL